jgi:hypothetical protein
MQLDAISPSVVFSFLSDAKQSGFLLVWLRIWKGGGMKFAPLILDICFSFRERPDGRTDGHINLAKSSSILLWLSTV